jgi:hypothetical protein
MLGMAKQEWREVVVGIGGLLRSLNIRLTINFQATETLNGTGRKYFRASIPIIKLCQTSFNRLFQITNSQQLILVKTSIKMEPNRLIKQLLASTEKAHASIYDYKRHLEDPIDLDDH